MSVVCPHCHRKVEFADARPKFCSHCGQALGDAVAAVTVDDPAEAPTRPPRLPGETETAPPAPPNWQIGGDEPQTVGPYRLLRRLGGGGMGTVYEAEDTASGRHVAVKLVQTEHAASPEVIQRFRQEGELASKLAHPRCVFVLAVDEDQGQPYIVKELMPGNTLADYVKEKGPLPPEEAIRKILDVIEGLQEAHQLGLIHRDVKPSNCFVEHDGRVKIGDFGLAKSLLQESHLTRTGTFIGTPLYASPEQIKMETVDARSDVYSVAATLYFLLTGRAPFQTGDPVASMARIVSDDPPSMRKVRPELPKALDKVVLRGLQRDPKRRWRTLEELRQGLRPFLPMAPSVGSIGLRVVAYWLDSVIVLLATTVINLGIFWLLLRRSALAVLTGEAISITGVVARNAAGFGLFLSYFGILEGLWGRTLGKRLLRLRVGGGAGNLPPGVGCAVLRAFVVYFMLNAGRIATQLVGVRFPLLAAPVDTLTDEQRIERMQQMMDYAAFSGPLFLWVFVGLGLMASTMRKRNGYRGLHEFLSGTRTYRMHWPVMRKRIRAVSAPELLLDLQQREGLPEKIGPYRIRGTLHQTREEKLLLADEENLHRPVWVWLRPASDPPLTESRRATSRTTRPRWMSCGIVAEGRWDAFLAPPGRPLTSLVAEGRRLSWGDFRGILEDLTEELRAECADGTLPRKLTPSQIWVAPDGRALLLDAPVGREASATTASEVAGEGETAQILTFFRDVSALALEGRSRPPADGSLPIRAPLPIYAGEILCRLVCEPSPKALDERAGDLLDRLHSDLLALQSEPSVITTGRRVNHLACHAMFALIALIVFGGCLSFAAYLPRIAKGVLTEGSEAVALALSVVLFFAPSFLFRGGASFLRERIAVIRPDGRPASRMRCLWRAVLAWGLFGLLVVGLPFGIHTALVKAVGPMNFGPIEMLVVGGLSLIAYSLLLLRNPARAPHDYLAGTYLVPK